MTDIFSDEEDQHDNQTQQVKAEIENICKNLKALDFSTKNRNNPRETIASKDKEEVLKDINSGKMTQTEAAYKLGVSKSTVSGWVNRKSKPVVKSRKVDSFEDMSQLDKVEILKIFVSFLLCKVLQR
ncbi:hypothetical protein DAMA08_043680 [Martiniozyma asiatica (nom. inval.)]|nr:hypothetical protein DAMA08_043680 [Martiniozyma asiatica]